MTTPPFTRVLLVEDEASLASTLKIALARLKIPEIEHASTIAAARVSVDEFPPDLLILDRNLPDGDGIELCAELRSNGFSGSILCLTAKGELDDRIDGLNSGADDYLPKPFDWNELVARIGALSRRRGISGAKPVDADLWKVDAPRLRIFGPKGWVELTPLEYKLATHLIDAAGKIVGREELLKEVWGFRFLPKTRTTDYFLGRLRKYFEKNPDEPRHFLTVRGAGYRFTTVPESGRPD